MSSKPFYITTPIYYVNDKPHLGHAYTTVAADTKARFHRLRGEPTRFLTGTDEHGQKLERAAREAGMDTLAFCKMNSDRFKALWEKLNIGYDDYIRTTEERHKQGVQEIWRRVEAAGDIYLGSYSGWYAVRDEAFYTEVELTEGPEGKKIAPSGAEVEWVEEPSYFFRLSKYEKPLLDYFAKNPDFIQPESRRNEIIRFVEGGLRDLSVSRTSFKWGIPVPGDEKHIIYVWFDALSNYLTATGFGPDTPSGGLDADSAWPANQHFIGKDILRFHAVYWPAFLLSAGIPLPGQVYGHGWWTVEGQKMSKSLGNAVDPHWLIEEYGVDAIRYFLLREIPFGADGDFSHDRLIGRINSDLANDLGNLLYRTLNMVKRYRKGKVSRAPDGEGEAEKALRAEADKAAAAYEKGMAATRFQEGLKAAWALISAGNKYIDASAPWELAKAGDDARLDTVLFHSVSALRVLAAMIWPAMPGTADSVAEQLGLPANWREAPFEGLLSMADTPGALDTKMGKPLFPRIEDEAREAIEKKVAARIAAGESGGSAAAGGKSAAGKEAAAGKAVAEKEEEETPEITFDEFKRLDLRTARVVSAESVPKSKKLIKLEVVLGEERRTVVAGLREHYAPEELVGRTVVVVANLKPAKLMGIESQGMILAAEDESGKLLLAGIQGEINPGSRLR